MFQHLVCALFLASPGLWLSEATGPVASAPHAVCHGAQSQGGLLVCDGPQGAHWQMGAVHRTADEEGRVLFGLTRDASSPAHLSVQTGTGVPVELSVEIAARQDAFRVIEGLDCDKVDARTPEQIEHAGRSWVLKQDAFNAFMTGPGVSQGFVRPAEGPASSPFGPQRKYIGISAATGESCEKVSVHRGYDIAAPIGTPIRAPAGGTVILADPDLYYEGGTVFLDHGQGLVSVFMHMSSVDVAAGDVLAQGDTLGKTGNTGRTTGPHLHWAVKWRNPDASDRGGDFYIDPALLLDLTALPVRGESASEMRTSATTATD